ncbi:MAG TPA: shikimate kinase [Fulvivirga sp.]|nr:shikimate kinase [Fulvivirga sp.]
MALSTRIFLIGMPASGKSTLGKELADLLQLQFIDLDTEIEEKEARTISEIFNKAGEDYFREVEQSNLFNIIDDKASFVMSTGGGTPCYDGNMSKMIKNGTVVFLDVPVEELLERLQNQDLATRPKLNQPDLESILTITIKSRRSYYQRAHYTLKGKAITAQEILATIKD